MYYQQLSDKEILEGFREGDAAVIREYFYGYCRVGWKPSVRMWTSLLRSPRSIRN